MTYCWHSALQDELFLHFFEQYGEVTFLLLFCGYKGKLA